MRFFFFIFVLVFIIIFNTKADNINSFEIDNLSIGDSLLKYLSKNEIQNNRLNYFTDKRKYYVVRYSKNLQTYQDLEIYLKSDDDDYIIRSISAGIYPKNLSECLSKKNEIGSEIEKVLSNLKFRKGSKKHSYYKNTTEYYSSLWLGQDNITISCLYFDKKDKQKYNVIDNLSVLIRTKEIDNWINSGYK